MVKSEKIRMDAVEKPPMTAWLIGLGAWLVPGLGHVLIRRWGRAVLLGGSVWMSFILGLAMGGHLFSPSTAQGSSPWLQVPPMIANLGAGLLYVFCSFTGLGFLDDPQQAARATYEYGNTFLLIAGLFNYLVALDAFDIAAGRKP